MNTTFDLVDGSWAGISTAETGCSASPANTPPGFPKRGGESCADFKQRLAEHIDKTLGAKLDEAIAAVEADRDDAYIAELNAKLDASPPKQKVVTQTTQRFVRVPVYDVIFQSAFVPLFPTEMPYYTCVDSDVPIVIYYFGE